MNQALL
jgi:hypothetical protein